MAAKKKPEPKAEPTIVENEYFKAKELQCKATGEHGFDPEFLELLTKIRKECGFSFPITSGYRSPKHPIEQRKSRLGAHTTGKAVDIKCSGVKALEIVSVAIANGITRIGVQQKGEDRFIHLDICTQEDFPDYENYPEETMWSY